MAQKQKETCSGTVRKERVKVECLTCLSEFNHDFKRNHEESCHGGQFVQVRNAGAPLNPFEAAKRPKKDETTATESIPIDPRKHAQSDVP